jgi:hypothetical protein
VGEIPDVVEGSGTGCDEVGVVCAKHGKLKSRVSAPIAREALIRSTPFA